MYTPSRLPRPDLKRLAALAAVALSAAACSMPMGSIMGDSKSRAPETTGSVSAAPGRAAAVETASLPPVGGTSNSSGPIKQADWGYARGALGLALTSNEPGAPVPWANPDTGSRGNFQPSAPAVTAQGQTCRDFVATRMENGTEVRLNGRACLNSSGQWDIEPTKRS